MPDQLPTQSIAKLRAMIQASPVYLKVVDAEDVKWSVISVDDDGKVWLERTTDRFEDVDDILAAFDAGDR